MKAHQTTIGATDEWLTPKYITDALGGFDLDPCSPTNRPWDTARKHYTIDDDGLSKDWWGRVWLNPPFNKRVRWEWMRRMAAHGNGIMLIPAAFETQHFRDYVIGKSNSILMMHHRPSFHHPSGQRAKGNAGGTICLVAYGFANDLALRESGLGAVFVEAA